MVECAKRSSLLKEQKSAFFNWLEIRESHKEKILKIYEEVKLMLNDERLQKHKHKFEESQDKLHVIVYGELFGGVYPHKEVQKVEGVKFIQKVNCLIIDNFF